jgi:hypothetical protein
MGIHCFFYEEDNLGGRWGWDKCAGEFEGK